MKSIFYVLTALALFGITSCARPDLSNGKWRATVKTESGVEIPFNFELSDSAGAKQLVILNAGERFKAESVTVEDDSVFIKLPLFDTEIRAKIGAGNLSGKSIKHLPDHDVPMEFSAQSNTSWRFFESPLKTSFNVTGRWASAFVKDSTTSVLVGEFKQEGNQLTGTFLSPTGDYRYLQGSVSGDKLYLSAYNGSNIYLFTATIQNDSTLIDGKAYLGYSTIRPWTARKDEKAALEDAYSLTSLKPGLSTLNFTFPDINGKKVSLADEKFKNKVVIIQFLGTWCPNCMDETMYLSPFYDKYRKRGVEIIGLAYERTPDFEASKKKLTALKKRFAINYDLLATGYTNDNAEVLKSIPALKNFMAFPTSIILNKKGELVKIHTGFSGQGTGSHYTEFTREFEHTIDSLIAQN